MIYRFLKTARLSTHVQHLKANTSKEFAATPRKRIPANFLCGTFTHPSKKINITRISAIAGKNYRIRLRDLPASPLYEDNSPVLIPELATSSGSSTIVHPMVWGVLSA